MWSPQHLVSLVAAVSTTTTLTLQRYASPSELAQAFALTPIWTSVNPPSSSLPSVSRYNETASWLNTNWSLGSKQLKAGNAAEGPISFVQDPFGTDGDAPTVLAVDYPKGVKGGTQFWPLPWGDVASDGTTASGLQPRTALLTYEVAFDHAWDFVKGGKLPGLYGGDQTNECTGGDRRYSCLSARFMWRPKGAGEVYAYSPTYNQLCQQPDVLCGDNIYGISLSRGAFNFQPGGWTRLTQLVSLNTPPIANGLLYVYVNDTLVLAQTGLSWRSDERVRLSRVLFSTFFGGSSKSYLPPKDERAYFRDFQVWSSDEPSNTTGPIVNASIYRPDGEAAGVLPSSAKALSAPSLIAMTACLLFGSAFTFTFASHSSSAFLGL